MWQPPEAPLSPLRSGHAPAGQVLWRRRCAPHRAATGAPSAPPPSPLRDTPGHVAAQFRTAMTALAGERTQVAGLFADLPGAMARRAECDPEAVRPHLEPVRARLMAAVHRDEGPVNQVRGDGMMARCGAPIAHDEHAVRACDGVLALQAASRRYSTAGREPPESDQAGEDYRQALALAEELGMRPLQARCHLGFGILYLKSGRHEQARNELIAAIASCRAMEMAFWFPQAEAALAQVEGP